MMAMARKRMPAVHPVNSMAPLPRPPPPPRRRRRCSRCSGGYDPARGDEAAHHGSMSPAYTTTVLLLSNGVNVDVVAAWFREQDSRPAIRRTPQPSERVRRSVRLCVARLRTLATRTRCCPPSRLAGSGDPLHSCPCSNKAHHYRRRHVCPSIIRAFLGCNWPTNITFWKDPPTRN
jgi:hypothetical protein